MNDERRTKKELIRELQQLRGQVACPKKSEQERHEIKEIYKENEKRYRTIFNNINEGVVIYKDLHDGDDFIFVDFNKEAEKIENVKWRDLIGKSVLQVFPGVKEFGLFEVFQRVWATGKAEHYPVRMYKDKRITGWRENHVYKLSQD
jgi:PAS domain S-box-containing protein